MAVPEGLDQVGTGAREPERRTGAWERGSRSEPAEKEGSGTVCPRWGKSGGGESRVGWEGGGERNLRTVFFLENARVQANKKTYG